MSWRDRFNSRGGGSDFLGRAADLASYTLPFGVWFGARVRLHLWLLLVIFLWYLQAFHDQSLGWITIGVALLIATLMLHEFAHRAACRHYRGRHDQFVLWPFGGMIPAPAPPYPLPTFIVHAAGIAANLAIFVITCCVLVAFRHVLPRTALSASAIVSGPAATHGPWPALAHGLTQFAFFNLALFAVNLLPYYWFDGGYLWQAILWPWAGLFRAINVTCIAGMVIAAPLTLLMLFALNLWGAIWWGLLFATAYMKRRELQRNGTGELDQAIAYSANMGQDDFSPAPSESRRPQRDRRAERQAAADQALQKKVDSILDKVRDHGMASLNRREQRTLKEATERERRRLATPRKRP